MMETSSFGLTGLPSPDTGVALSMMCLSHSTGYAVRALGCLARAGGRPQLIRDVAERAGVPRPYLAQIVSRLAGQGIITAKRGCRGGIALSQPADQISLLEVVEAVEGKEWISPCMLGGAPERPDFACPTQQFWQRIRRQIEAKLRSTTLADVVAPAKPASPNGIVRIARPRRGGAARARWASMTRRAA